MSDLREALKAIAEMDPHEWGKQGIWTARRIAREALAQPQDDGEAVALYQCELEDGRIEHSAGCFGEVLEINGVRVVRSTALYTAPPTEARMPLDDELAGCREALKKASIKSAKDDAKIADLNEMVLRYMYRAENSVWALGKIQSLCNRADSATALLSEIFDVTNKALSRAGDNHASDGKESEGGISAYLSRPVCSCFDEASRSFCLNKDNCRPMAKAIGATTSDHTPPDATAQREAIARIVRANIAHGHEYAVAVNKITDAILALQTRAGG